LENGACVAEAASRFTAASASSPRGCDTTIVSQAGVTFTLHKNDVEINSAHWSSGKSEMEASGKITDFRHPHIEAKYKGRVELETVGLLFGQTELRDGIVDLNGSFRYMSSEDFFSSGQLTLKDGAYSASGFRLSGVDAHSDYSVDVDRMALTHLRGHALGGGFSGGVSLLHWAKIAPKSRMSVGRREKPQFKPQEGSAQITLSGIQLMQGLRALLPPKNPFNQLRIASNAEGKLGIRWTGSPTSSEIAIDLSTQAPAAVSSSELPLTGSVQATYHAGEDRVDVAGLSLSGRATRMNATGAIGTQAQLRLSLNTTDFSELAPVMRALGSAEGPLPAIVHGQASFNGTVTGKFAAPTLIGHLQTTDFDTVLSANIHFGNQVPEKANNRPARRIHWDSLVADITYSPTTASARNVVVKRGRAQITGSEKAGLIDGQLEPTSPLQVQMALHNTDFADLQQILGTTYPVTGTFNGHVTLNGTRENLDASGHLQLAGGAICQEPYHSLTADVQFRGDEVALRNVSLLQDGGRISGGATYSFDAEQFSFNLTGNNFDLAHISRLQGRKISVGGHAEFTAYGSGTLSQPSINARVSVSGLIFNGEPAGDLVATGTTRGSDLHVEAHTNTQLASANLNGDVQMQGDLPAEAHLDLVKLNFDPLLRVYLPASVTGHSSLSGRFLLRGPLKHPRQIVITADVDQFAAEIQDVKLHNQAPLRFTIGNQIATVEQLHIVGTDTDITGTGKVELTGAGHVDLHGNGHVNLAIVHSLNRGISSSGQMTFTVNAIGKLDDPSLSGNMQIADGTFALSDLPNGLSQINGTLSFDTNRLRVQKLTAKTGGGDLVLGGYITYSNGVFFDLTATGRDVRIRYPEGVSSQATADLRLVGTLQNSLLSGDVTVTKFGLTPQFDLAAYVQRAKQPPTPPNPNSLVDNVRLDVHIVSTPELRLETSLARVSGDVDIHLRGTAARPSVLGRVSIAEGDITFNSTTYHLERGDIVFANPVRIEPVVNVEASARVRDYDITLGFHGTPEKLNITYRSEPPLPSADIIALLAFGRTRQESELQAEQGSQAASQQSFAQTASNAILGEALNSAVSSRVQKLFGISRIKIDPNLGGTEDNPNARLTIEQQVSKDVTVTYLTNLGQYPEEVLQVEYNINKNISVVAVRDYTGVLAIDFRIRQRKR
jgi:translocation and assembly module TamB